MTFRTAPNSGLGVQQFVVGYVDTVAKHPIGTIVKGVDATQGEAEFIYLPGAANVVEGSTVVYDLLPSGPAVVLTNSATHLNAGRPIAVALCAIGATNYGWYQVSGVAKVKGIAGGVIGRCMLTTTDGALDDTAIAGCQVLGARLSSNLDTPAVGFVYVTMNRPTIQGQIT